MDITDRRTRIRIAETDEQMKQRLDNEIAFRKGKIKWYEVRIIEEQKKLPITLSRFRSQIARHKRMIAQAEEKLRIKEIMQEHARQYHLTTITKPKQ